MNNPVYIYIHIYITFTYIYSTYLHNIGIYMYTIHGGNYIIDVPIHGYVFPLYIILLIREYISVCENPENLFGLYSSER